MSYLTGHEPKNNIVKISSLEYIHLYSQYISATQTQLFPNPPYKYFTVYQIQILLFNHLPNFTVNQPNYICDHLQKTRHNAAYVNIKKRLIDFLKMYSFKPIVDNHQVSYRGINLSFDNTTWTAQYLNADDSVSAKNIFLKGAALHLVFLQTVTYFIVDISTTISPSTYVQQISNQFIESKFTESNY